MPKIKLLNSNHFVVKSNALIEARYRLSLQESHVILWLLTKIRPDDEDFKQHKLDIADFAEMVGLNVKGQYGELQKITETLMRRILKIEKPENDETLQVAWLSSARYQHKKGCILLEFSPQLKPYLLQLKSHFTKIDIVETLRLKSIYAVRIFELLLQYEHIGKRETSIENLKSFCGIEKKEYRLYADLKRYVIDRAKTEINAKTEYEIDYTETKESRKVIAIEWTIQKKTHFEKTQIEKADIIQKELRSENAILQQLLEYGFTNSHSKKIIKSNSQERIINALKAVDIQISRGRVKNPKAMLIKAIQEKWHHEKYRDKNLKIAC